MKKNLYYYSVVTFLAIKISEKYYNDIHYVWCTPTFDSDNPPSSNPKEILLNLKKDIERQDLHSSKIRENRAGLLKGAKYKKEAGVINEEQFGVIAKIIKYSKIEAFRPFLCIIHADSVKNNVKEATILKKAGFWSKEYLIDKLSPEQFDLIEL